MSLEEPEQHQYGGGGGEHPDALLAATSIPYSQVSHSLFVSAGILSDWLVCTSVCKSHSLG